MVSGYPATQRRDSGSTGIELNSYPYTPNPRHTEHHFYPEDDRESIRTAVVSYSNSDEENLLYGKGSATSAGRPRHGGPRTPSPTPSELKELQTGAINWDAMKSWRYWIRREWLWYYVALIIAVVITILVSVFHKQIVHWLTPAAEWLRDTTGGWLVPIAVLFVISFPPLFGHEIVAILCGLVWGFWIGFGIVSAGTLLGEIGNFYAFKYCCRSRGGKLERTNISYACLARVVRDGGFKIALIVRLSAIPGHFTTAIFSTCGMGIIVFTIAAILSMPKQILGVYLGVILKESESGNSDKKGRIVSNIVLAITVIITVVAMWYIVRQMNKVKPEVIYKRRKARQEKLSLETLPSSSGPYLSAPTRGHRSMASESTIVVDDPYKPYKPQESLSTLPSRDTTEFPTLAAPQPRRPVSIDRRAYIPESSRGSSPDSMYGEPQPGPYNSRHAAVMQESTEDVGWDVGAGGSQGGHGLGARQFEYQATPYSGSSSHLDRGGVI